MSAEPLTRPSPAGRGLYAALAAALLCLASLAVRWPGVAMYDSVSQYEQALAGDYADWHPPIMAHVWALLLRVWPGTAPFLLLQMLLWWGGLGLLATALTRRGRAGGAALVLAVGAFPLFLGWTTVVLKDAQMAACLVAATGIVGWWRLDGRPLPRLALAALVPLIGYATLVRGNAVFATVPLALALGHWAGARHWWTRTALALAGSVAVLAISPLVNQRLLRAEATHNDRSLPLYDIVAIAHRAHLANPPGLSPADWAEAERRGCYTPYFWNPYGEPAQCDWIGRALAFEAGASRPLLRDWARLVLAHPLAYARHRAAHFNATLRFLVGPGEPDAVPPLDTEPNEVGLGAPSGRFGQGLIAAARITTATPLGWPVVWMTAAVALLLASRGAAGEAVALARALALSALAMSGSFAVASIACDLRYHLWSMVAVALALILAGGALPGRRWIAGASAVLTVALLASLARFVSPPVYVPLPAHGPPPGIEAH